MQYGYKFNIDTNLIKVIDTKKVRDTPLEQVVEYWSPSLTLHLQQDHPNHHQYLIHHPGPDHGRGGHDRGGHDGDRGRGDGLHHVP